MSLSHYVNQAPTSKEQIKAWVEVFTGFSIHDTVRCIDHDPETGHPHTSQLDYVAGGFLGEYSSCVYMAARNAGKSYAASILCLMDMWFKPGVKIAVAAFQRNQSDYIYEYLVKFIEVFEAKIGKKIAEITKDDISFTNGSSAKFFSGGKSQAGIKGYHPNILIVDEGDLFSAEQFDGIANALEAGGTFQRRFDVLSTNYTVSGAGVILRQIERYELYNKKLLTGVKPCRVFRTCLLDILVECDDRFHCDTCPVFKYCKGRAKEGTGFYKIESALETMRDSSLPTFESQMLLLRPSSEFTYFENFSAVNIVDDIQLDSQKEWFVDFDFGGSRCPHAAVIVMRDVPKGREDIPTYYVVDEFLGMGLLENLIGQIKAKYPKILDAQCFCDPAGNRREQNVGAQSTVQTLRKAGFFPRFRQLKRRQTFELLYKLISPATGATKLLIAKRCKNLIAQIQAAEHSVVKGKPTTEPADITPDDLLDCLRTCVGNTLGTFAKHHGNNKILRYF